MKSAGTRKPFVVIVGRAGFYSRNAFLGSNITRNMVVPVRLKQQRDSFGLLSKIEAG
jgi:hypothetical protein